MRSTIGRHDLCRCRRSINIHSCNWILDHWPSRSLVSLVLGNSSWTSGLSAGAHWHHGDVGCSFDCRSVTHVRQTICMTKTIEYFPVYLSDAARRLNTATIERPLKERRMTASAAACVNHWNSKLLITFSIWLTHKLYAGQCESFCRVSLSESRCDQF